MFCQNLLTAQRAIPATATVGVASNVAIDMANIVPILLVECIIGDVAETLAPEQQTLFQVEADALQEKRVLETPIVLEMSIAAERAM